MYRHVWAEINLNALRHNIKEISSLVPVHKIMGVVKANAYGHGAGEVAKELTAAGVKAFAVSNAYEALDLRFLGVEGEILVLGNVDFGATKELAQNNITVCVYDLEYAKQLSFEAQKQGVTLKCHIKVDTGMGRLGVDFRSSVNESSASELKEILNLKGLYVTGVFTHFPAADRDSDEDGTFTKAQYERFLKVKEIVLNLAERDDIAFHCSNSAATLLENKTILSDYYRAGIMLYGLTPAEGLKLPIKLQPVMTLKSVITQVKTVNEGDFISYGRSFKAKTQMKLATVAIGYADGFFRSNSGKGKVLINGKEANIVGRVCMDQTIVDVTHIENVKTGDTAIIFGDGLAIEEAAKTNGTINYELVCAVAHRVPRVYTLDGKEIKVIRHRSV